MSIEFAALQGLSIPEGVVTQITDAAGNVLWSSNASKAAAPEVTENMGMAYAGEPSGQDE